MACGCPVITSNVGACPEIVDDAAIKVDPDDTDTLGKVTAKVLSDDSYANQLSRKGLERAKEFQWRISALKLKATFEHLQ